MNIDRVLVVSLSVLEGDLSAMNHEPCQEFIAVFSSAQVVLAKVPHKKPLRSVLRDTSFSIIKVL
jgi:hypothetical protein